MSKKSRSSRNRPDRPFDPAILKRARQIADSYQIVIRCEKGEYYGRGLELPWAMEDGRTPEECVEKTRDVLTTAVAVMLEDGDTPPPAASEGLRSEQVNLRLTPEEKLTLEGAAQQQGYRGLSDFVRSAALAATK